MIAVGLVLLALAAWCCMALLSAAGVPGTHGRPAIVGGVVAGVLLGPTLLGRAAPALHEDLYVGARQAREVWSTELARLEAQRIAEQAAGLIPGPIPEAAAGPPAGLVPGGVTNVGPPGLEPSRSSAPEPAAAHSLEQAWKAAAWSERWPQRIAALILGCLVLLASPLAALRGMLGPGGPGSAPAKQIRRAPGNPQHARWLDATWIGLWSSAMPILGCVLLLWLLGLPVMDVAALWTFAALAVGPWILDRTDHAIAEESQAHGALLMRRAGTVASMVAVAALAVALARASAGAQPAPGDAGSILSGAGMTLVILLLGIATLLGRLDTVRASPPDSSPALLDPARGAPDVDRPPTLDRPSTDSQTPDQRLASLFATWLLPPLAALAMVRIELFRDAVPWLIVGLLLLAGDGRVLGAWLGAVLPGGSRILRAMRLALVAGGAAPCQVAIVAPALCMELLSVGQSRGAGLGSGAGSDPAAGSGLGFSYGLALLVAAAFMEITGSVRPRVARSIRELEEESEDVV